MSIVSTVTIFTSVGDGWGKDAGDRGHEPTELISEINGWLAHRGSLKDLCPAYGGNKYAEQGVWGGAFNMLPVEEFVAFVLARRWEGKRDFLMIVQTHEGAPQIWDAYGEAQA